MRTLDRDIEEIISDAGIDWNAFRGATFFVTGATGLIGSLVIKVLLAGAPEVKIAALVRDAERGRRMLGDNIEFVVGDVREPVSFSGSVDYIVHCASVTASKYMVTNPVETLSVAVAGTENVLRFASEQKSLKGMLYLSSMEVYGVTGQEQNPVTEEKLGFVDLTSPRSSYPEGKRVSELLCRAYFSEYGVPVKIARLAQTFGAGIPLTDNRVSMQFARSALSGEDIVLHTAGRSVSNFCYTADALRGLLTILSRGEDGQAYNVCFDSESRTIAEIAELVADKVAGGRISVVYDIPESNTYGYAPDAVMRLNSDKLRRLGWEPCVGMEEAYRRLTAYLAESRNES